MTYSVESGMVRKRILSQSRLRRIPGQFSWIDQRLVFEGHLRRCDARAAALYLLLLTVADAQGLSYWGDERVMSLLSLRSAELERAREDLLSLGLIAYERPLYQVLALDGLASTSTGRPAAASPPSCPSPRSAPRVVNAGEATRSEPAAMADLLAQLRARTERS